MVFSTRQGSGVLGTQEQPLEAVTFEATIEHAQNSILSFIAKIRTRSGRSLAELKGQNLVLQIDDTAPAPASADMPRLFERLFRGEASRTRALGGSGLGLALCKSPVEAHGGQITAHMSPLGGLQIHIHLPLASALETDP